MRTSSLILILSASGSACSSASRIAVLVLLLVCTEPRVRLLVSIPAIELLLDERLAPWLLWRRGRICVRAYLPDAAAPQVAR